MHRKGTIATSGYDPLTKDTINCPSRHFISGKAMKKLAFLIIAIGFAISGCKKEEGCIFFFRRLNPGKGNPAEICVIEPDGKNTKTIFSKKSPFFGTEIDVSPDGKKIAFYEIRDGKEVAIYIMDVDGKNEYKLIGDYNNGEPSWSPDGKKIAFSSDRDGKSNEIYVIDIDGKNLLKLTENSLMSTSPSWSFDGEKIIFDSIIKEDIPNFKDYLNDEIFIIGLDGKGLKRLTNNYENDENPSYSPDGSKIAFTRGLLASKLYIMDPDGSNQIQLTEENMYVSYLCWSPDSKKIVFSGSNRDMEWDDLYTIDIQTKKIKNLTNTKDFDESSPRWRSVSK
ncbi:MAG: hypothetical protein AB1297_05150 [bacterium]